MTKFHINDKGLAGACKARNNKCPFGGFDEHYESINRAQEVYEEKQEMIAQLSKQEKSQYTRHPLTQQSLDSSLSYNGPVPKWFKKDSKKSIKIFGTEPEIIDIVELNGAKTAVIWSENSLQENDSSVQLNDGYNVSTIEYRNFKTGETLGYLKARYIDEDSLNNTFGNDDYSNYRILASQGEIFDAADFKTVEIPKIITYSKDELKIDTAKTDEEKLESYKKLWHSLHDHFELSPISNADKKFYSLSVNDAPNSIEEIKEDLKQVEPYAEQVRDDLINSAKYPLIDYSRISNELRGQGLGSSLYIYSARKLAEKGRVLSSSSIQSQEAQNFWKRVIKDKEIPVKVITRRFQKGDIHQNKNSFAIDFTKDFKQPESVEIFKTLKK